jgi:hypothetical protein
MMAPSIKKLCFVNQNIYLPMEKDKPSKAVEIIESIHFVI